MSSNYMSILFEKDGLSFLVVKSNDIIASEFSAYETNLSLEENLNNIYDKNLYFKQSYDAMSFAILDARFILVPKNYYDNDNEKWLGFNSEIHEGNTIFNNPLHNHDIELIYTVPQELQSFVKSKYNNNCINHSGQVLLDTLSLDAEKEQVFINVHQEQFEIIVTQSGKIILYNIFDFKTKEDLTYHLLNVLRQLNLDPNTIELYYYNIEQEITLKMIMNFVRHVIPATSDIQRLKHFTLIENLQTKL